MIQTSQALYFAALLSLLAGCAERTERTFLITEAPTITSTDEIIGKLLYYKQSSRYLIATLQIKNTGSDRLIIRGDGAQMADFTATCEGRQIAAQRGLTGRWSAGTGTTVHETNSGATLEIPAGQMTEIQLRWNYSPPLSKNGYDWEIHLGGLFRNEQKIKPLVLSFSHSLRSEKTDAKQQTRQTNKVDKTK